jgi:hypothetical protein
MTCKACNGQGGLEEDTGGTDEKGKFISVWSPCPECNYETPTYKPPEPVIVREREPEASRVAVLPEIVQRVGVANNKALGFPVMFQRLLVKNSTKFRVWPVAGDNHYLELDPSEWRAKYTVLEEHITDAERRPT